MFAVTLAYFMTYKYVIGLYFNIQKYNASAMSVEIQDFKIVLPFTMR